ncbi:MAG: 16S rRNA (adenine(1518)-N(6)/adenine(1519)-N(6))-dimethyltransferase RsmA [Acidimicrobiales bacterium]
MTHSGADISTLLETHGLRPSRALGQNFVADPNTVRRIARLAGLGPGSPVLEFGAGLGSLTLALAETGARVVSVELDRHLLPVLRSVVEGVGVEVLEGDAMTLDIGALLAERGGGAWSLVSNLPYNLATPLVLRTLVEVPAVAHLLVMVQREVGERMAATVGDPAYGSVSVRVAYFARSRVVGRVPASVFVPRPRVESVLVRMERRPEPAVDPAEVPYPRLAAVVKAGFGQRRKMLRRSLAGVVDPEAFDRAGIRPEARAEELTVEEWGRLAR